VVSAVSIWEIRLKWSALHATGERKELLDPAQALRLLAGQAIRFLDMTAAQALAALTQPVQHRDPFDELLLAQAQAEGLRLLTRDKPLAGHPLAMSV
jgi:PIN domain nuclease of toxin-antitoxin system